MDKERDLDALLNAALAEYSGREAPIGIEARVIRRVHERRHGIYRWLWVPALAVAASVAFVIIQKPEPQAPLPVVSIQRRLVAPPVAPAEVATALPRPTLRRRTRELTPQQLALLSFATKYPEDAARFLKEAPEELSVKELSVAPLTVTELDQ